MLSPLTYIVTMADIPFQNTFETLMMDSETSDVAKRPRSDSESSDYSSAHKKTNVVVSNEDVTLIMTSEDVNISKVNPLKLKR